MKKVKERTDIAFVRDAEKGIPLRDQASGFPNLAHLCGGPGPRLDPDIIVQQSSSCIEPAGRLRRLPITSWPYHHILWPFQCMATPFSFIPHLMASLKQILSNSFDIDSSFRMRSSSLDVMRLSSLRRSWITLLHPLILTFVLSPPILPLFSFTFVAANSIRHSHSPAACPMELNLGTCHKNMG